MEPSSSPMSTGELGPEQIRALRGQQSRAAFARKLEVTPHAVYRWELPRDAKESRTPRGRERDRLLALRELDPSRPLAGAAGHRAGEPEHRDLDAAIDRLFGVEHETEHARLLDVLAHGSSSAAERAMTSAALAVYATMHHFDGERALLALGPALEWLRSAERIDDEPAVAWVLAADAIAHAMPSARYFDPKLVGERAHAAVRIPVADDRCKLIAACAHTCASSLLGNDAAMGYGLELLPRIARHALPELMASHFDELRALGMLFHGESGSARGLLQSLVEPSIRLGCAPHTARVLGALAMRQLDDLSDPLAALALTVRARQEVERGRLGPGLHESFVARAEIEANARAGDIPAAVRALEAHDRRTLHAPFSTFPAIASAARVLMLSGRYDELDARSSQLRASCTGVFAEGADAYASYMEAFAIYGRGAATSVIIAAFERAEAKAHRSEILLRDVLVWGTGAVAASGDPTRTDQWLRRTQRLVDRLPSLWATAQVRRLEGVTAATYGEWPRARALLEMALAAFDAASDRIGRAMVRWLYASMADAFGEPQRVVPPVVDTLSELESIGIVLPGAMVAGVAATAERLRESGKADSNRPRSWATRLLVPVARLTVRGVDQALLERELVTIAGELLAPREFRLDELDAAGNARGTALPYAAGIEFGDGSGRRLRLSTTAAIDEDERAALGVLVSVTSLALESSQARSFGASVPQARDEDDQRSDFVAASLPLRELRRDVKVLAASSATVVITGESGTGKEVIARALHDGSPRAHKPFVAFNCATVPRELFEGQLFGHKRGAFTGATGDQIGMLRAAEGGTLFLDEIAELPLDVQPKLLRVLENHEVTPLGSSKAVKVDARIVAATHRDLGTLVRAGTFREDLFFRLQVVRLWVPPLRERREDILPLARHFLAQLVPDHPVELAADAAARLTAYDFPGNVRELRNIVERSLAYAPGAEVLHADALRLADR